MGDPKKTPSRTRTPPTKNNQLSCSPTNIDEEIIVTNGISNNC